MDSHHSLFDRSHKAVPDGAHFREFRLKSRNFGQTQSRLKFRVIYLNLCVGINDYGVDNTHIEMYASLEANLVTIKEIVHLVLTKESFKY